MTEFKKGKKGIRAKKEALSPVLFVFILIDPCRCSARHPLFWRALVDSANNDRQQQAVSPFYSQLSCTHYRFAERLLPAAKRRLAIYACRSDRVPSHPNWYV